MKIKADGYIEKASKLAEGEVEFVVSTNAIDAHGERINVDGIELADFKKNPVVLWGHDGFNLPIAKATKVWKDGGKLMARAQFYMKDDFARKVYGYIVDGYLNAVSIGGVVKEWAEDGITIAKMNMKEFSVVSVPANQEALVASKSLSGEQQAELRSLGNMYARYDVEADLTLAQVYAKAMYEVFTETGIRDLGLAIEAVDTANYIVTGRDFKNTSSPSVPVTISGGWVVDGTTGLAIDLVDTTGGTLFLAPNHVVAYEPSIALTNADLTNIEDVVEGVVFSKP